MPLVVPISTKRGHRHVRREIDMASRKAVRHTPTATLAQGTVKRVPRDAKARRQEAGRVGACSDQRVLPNTPEYLVTFGSLVVATSGIVRAFPGSHTLVVLDPERAVRIADLRPGMRTRWLGTVRRIESRDSSQTGALDRGIHGGAAAA